MTLTLKRREKILAGVAGGLVFLLAAWFLVPRGDGRTLARLLADRAKLTADVEKKDAKVQTAARAAEQMAEWRRRSLPTDPARARSLYQNWLRAAAERAGIRQLNVDSSEGQSRRNVYTLFQFTVRGRASLGALTQFLYAFYSAGYLHQIRRMDLKPVEGSESLEVSLTVEAMSLPGADSKDKLNEERGNRLKSESVADYREAISGRNLFAPYVPPRREERAPEFDPARYTYVTAILEVDGKREVWLMDRTAGKTLQLKEGEKFHIGDASGSIKTIGVSDVLLDLDGSERRLAYGDRLAGGRETPAKGEMPASASEGRERRSGFERTSGRDRTSRGKSRGGFRPPFGGR